MNSYVVIKTFQVSSKNMETWVKKLIKFLALINFTSYSLLCVQ